MWGQDEQVTSVARKLAPSVATRAFYGARPNRSLIDLTLYEHPGVLSRGAPTPRLLTRCNSEAVSDHISRLQISTARIERHSSDHGGLAVYNRIREAAHQQHVASIRELPDGSRVSQA